VDPIDDDWEIQATVLARAGFDVLDRPSDPIGAAREQRPDVVVVDFSPRRVGVPEFVEALKTNERTAQIPVVLVSACPRSDSPHSEGFVSKPNAPDALLREIARVLARSKAAPGL
jgi:CheY-like chemotaxis protein